MESELLLEWTQLEIYIGEKFPTILKYLLRQCGYDSVFSLKFITEQSILKMEHYINKEKLSIFEQLNSDDVTMFEYKKEKLFEFLPGHKEYLLGLPKAIYDFQSHKGESNMKDNTFDFTENMPNQFSVILSKLIETALKNKDKPKNAYQYGEVIKDFSTYIFILCGRTCYETLHKNLPIPPIKTICKR